MNFRNKVLLAVVSIAILLINIITIEYMIQYCNQIKRPVALEKNNPFFGVPSEMVLYSGKKRILLTPESETYKRILELNEERTTLIESFMIMDGINITCSESICLEYRFDKPYDFVLPMNLELRCISVNSFIFVLTGEYNDYFCINTEGQVINNCSLNTNVELINIAISLLEKNE